MDAQTAALKRLQFMQLRAYTLAIVSRAQTMQPNLQTARLLVRGYLISYGTLEMGLNHLPYKTLNIFIQQQQHTPLRLLPLLLKVA